MKDALQRAGRSVQELYTEHADRVYRLAWLYMKNHHDSEDVVQDVFVKLLREIQNGKRFENAEHEKAWLLVTAANTCKNRLRAKSRTELNLDDYCHLAEPTPENTALLEAILKLPDKYKTVIYLFYYEGYRTEEIGRMMRQRPATIRAWLSRARRQLKKELGGDFFEQ